MFSSNQFINYTRITLDDFDELIRHILIHIVRHWNTQVIILVHLHSHVNRLQQMFTINTCKDKVALIQCFGSLGRGTDAYRREGMSYSSKKAAFLLQCTEAGHHAKGVHLQTIVVMEAQRLMLNHTLVKNEATLLQTLATTGMARVQDGQIVLFCHLVDSGEQRSEILLCVDVFLPVDRQKDVLSLLQSQTGVNIECFNLTKVLMKYLCHGKISNIGALFGQTGVCQIAASMLGVRHIHIGDDVHETAIGFFRKKLVIAAVARFHMKDRDV